MCLVVWSELLQLSRRCKSSGVILKEGSKNSLIKFVDNKNEKNCEYGEGMWFFCTKNWKALRSGIAEVGWNKKCIFSVNLGSNKNLCDRLGAWLWKMVGIWVTVKNDFFFFFPTANRRNKVREVETLTTDFGKYQCVWKFYQA